MIAFVFVPKKSFSEVDYSLGETYTHLFNKKYIWDFTAAETFIANQICHQLKLPIKDAIKAKAGNGMHYFLQISAEQKQILNKIYENASLLIFSTREDANRFVNQVQNSDLARYFRKNSLFPTQDTPYLIINKEQKSLLCQWAPVFIRSRNNQELGTDLQKKLLIENAISITTSQPCRIHKLHWTAGKLFFKLTKEGIKVYCKEIKDAQYFKSCLTDFDFHSTQILSGVKAPSSAPEFENHTCFVFLPHGQVEKLLKLYNPDLAKKLFQDLYEVQKLDPEKYCNDTPLTLIDCPVDLLFLIANRFPLLVLLYRSSKALGLLKEYIDEIQAFHKELPRISLIGLKNTIIFSWINIINVA